MKVVTFAERGARVISRCDAITFTLAYASIAILASAGCHRSTAMHVELDAYSGRQNPTWTLSATGQEELVRKLRGRSKLVNSLVMKIIVNCVVGEFDLVNAIRPFASLLDRGQGRHKSGERRMSLVIGRDQDLA